MHRAPVIFVGLATLFSFALPASADPAVAVDPGVALERLARSPSLVNQPIAVFLQTRDVAATRRAVERAGGRIGTVAGDVVTARLPLDAVGRLGTAGVVRVEAARAVKPRLERALPEIGADQLHIGEPPLPGPVKGAGVIVGVIDIGLDLTHPAFQHASGTTRLISLWDQTAMGTPPGTYDYGDECDAAEIDAGTCAHAAEAAHGTHVTGIAAGGAVEGVPYVGLAPEADLVFVNLGEPPGAASETEAISTAICDGVAYIFARADERGQPAVVNMSLGMHGDPHDGGSLASRCLDNLTGPGRILVAAAGNEGQGSAHPVFGEQVQVHASAVTSSQPQRVAFLVPPGKQDVFVYFDDGCDLAIKIGAMAAPGRQVNLAGVPVVFTPPVTVDSPLEPTTLELGTKTLGSIAAAGGVLDTGVRGIQIRVADDDSDNAEAQVVWVLEMIGNGRFDGFIDTTGGGGFLRLDALPIAVDSAMTIGYPAVSAKVLAVASYVTRSEWVTADGVMHTQTNPLTGEPVVVGERSAFSSRGPSRNPQVTGPKPDIAAPGELIASALNHLAATSEPAERILVPSPGGYLLQEGTSMASPVVTGVVALMLDVDPELDVDRVREILSATAALPEGGHADDWGRGKIDAFTAVLAADPGDGGKYDRPGERSTSGCGCHVPGSPGGAATVALIAAVALWVTRRRRR